MGSYAELYFDSVCMLSSKNGVGFEILSIFSDRDRKVIDASQLDEYMPFLRSRLKQYDIEIDIDEKYFIYQTQASYVKDRLDLMGINLKNLELMFYDAVNESKVDGWFNDDSEAGKLMNKLYNDRGLSDDIGYYTFEYWKKLVKEATSRLVGLGGIPHDTFDYLGSKTFSRYIDTYGFPSYYLDLRYLLRILLEYLPDTHIITLDYSDLVYGGYENEDSLLCEEMLDSSAHDYSINGKIIVLTEGSTDLLFLKSALRLLYPHIQDNFAFADFSEFRAQGGAPSLIAYVKVLISMSIKNRIIAIFDADAAAEDSLRSIQNLAVPKNIMMMQLPYLEEAEFYPTIGPTGETNSNINGLACSIELYLPKEIITDSQGNYYPVHWRGYVQGIEKYQGEISRKREIMNCFIDVIKDIDNGNESVDKYNWDNMRLVFSTIFLVLSGGKL